jgi:8-oxo-dGTP pyrophosphatase MutT (NUDIX family)
MPTARSAGVVVYRIPPGQSEPQFLLLDNGKFWDYPKGHVEAGEDDLTAALRELREEAGIAEVELAEGFRHEITYFFRDQRRGLIRKTVVFFLARVAADAQVTISREHVGAEFVGFDEALRRARYSTAKETLKKAREFLDAAPR